MSSWGWKNRRHGREYVPHWLRPLSVAVPWLTVGLLFMMLYLMGGTFTSAEGTLVALPRSSVGDISSYSAVALVLPTAHGTLVFFDDTRYVLEDDVQMDMFATQLKDRMAASPEENTTLLVLADMRVRHGDLLRFAAIARQSDVRQVLFARKSGDGNIE